MNLKVRQAFEFDFSREKIFEIKKEMIIFVTYSQAAQRVQSLFLISKTLTSMAFKDPTMMLPKTTGPMILRGVS